MTTISQFNDHLIEYFNNEQVELDKLDSLGWVGLIAFLSSKNIIVDLSLLPSVDSVASLYSISKNECD